MFSLVAWAVELLGFFSDRVKRDLSNGAGFVSIRWLWKTLWSVQGRHGKVAFLENRDFVEILLKIDLLQFWGAFSKPGAFPKPAQVAE